MMVFELDLLEEEAHLVAVTFHLLNNYNKKEKLINTIVSWRLRSVAVTYLDICSIRSSKYKLKTV